MYRALAAAAFALLVAPAAALAATEEKHTDKVTETMFALILGLIALLAIIAAIEARRQK